jgi:hypothetical protein
LLSTSAINASARSPTPVAAASASQFTARQPAMMLAEQRPRPSHRPPARGTTARCGYPPETQRKAHTPGTKPRWREPVKRQAGWASGLDARRPRAAARLSRASVSPALAHLFAHALALPIDPPVPHALSTARSL